MHVAAYVEQLSAARAAPTVKQHLAALRAMFGALGVHRDNPADGVRGPKHVVRVGRTPVLSAEQARRLLDSIDASTLRGARDRALIGVMIFSFARVSAVLGMDVDDDCETAGRRWLRRREKGGKEHVVPAHPRVQEYLDAYLALARTRGADMDGGPMFRTVTHKDILGAARLSCGAAWDMVKRRARAVGLPESTTNHSFRATGITVYLERGGSIENARLIAGHASVKTTQTYDRRDERITLDEIARISL